MKRPNYYSSILKENGYLVRNACNLPETFCKGFLPIFLIFYKINITIVIHIVAIGLKTSSHIQPGPRIFSFWEKNFEIFLVYLFIYFSVSKWGICVHMHWWHKQVIIWIELPGQEGQHMTEELVTKYMFLQMPA